jgi:hypothetical protein
MNEDINKNGDIDANGDNSNNSEIPAPLLITKNQSEDEHRL